MSSHTDEMIERNSSVCGWRYIYIYIYMALDTEVQSQVKSYQRLKKWYLMPPCLGHSIIRYVSRVKWSNQGKEVAPSPTPWCCSYWKGNLLVALDYGCQLYLWIYICFEMNRSTMRFYFAFTYVYVSSLLLSSKNMWHEAMWMGYSMTLELTCVWMVFSFPSMSVYPLVKIKNPSNMSEFKSHWVPHSHGLVSHVFTDESNKLEIYSYLRMKWINKSVKNTNLSICLSIDLLISACSYPSIYLSIRI